MSLLALLPLAWAYIPAPFPAIPFLLEALGIIALLSIFLLLLFELLKRRSIGEKKQAFLKLEKLFVILFFITIAVAFFYFIGAYPGSEGSYPPVEKAKTLLKDIVTKKGVISISVPTLFYNEGEIFSRTLAEPLGGLVLANAICFAKGDFEGSPDWSVGALGSSLSYSSSSHSASFRFKAICDSCSEMSETYFAEIFEEPTLNYACDTEYFANPEKENETCCVIIPKKAD